MDHKEFREASMKLMEEDLSDKGITDFLEAVGEYRIRSSSTLCILKGGVLFKDNPEKAKEYLQWGIDIDSASPVPYFPMALYYMSQGDFKNAKENLEVVLKYNIETQEILDEMFTLIKEAEKNEAQSDGGEVLERD